MAGRDRDPVGNNDPLAEQASPVFGGFFWIGGNLGGVPTIGGHRGGNFVPADNFGLTFDQLYHRAVFDRVAIALLVDPAFDFDHVARTDAVRLPRERAGRRSPRPGVPLTALTMDRVLIVSPTRGD